MSKSLLVALHFRRARPTCWAAQLGLPVGLCGPVWDLGVVSWSALGVRGAPADFDSG
jgi:hypothetical protein